MKKISQLIDVDFIAKGKWFLNVFSGFESKYFFNNYMDGGHNN